MSKEQLLSNFRNYLLERGLGPRDKLDGEIELARLFEVSRGDIREVIMHLCHLGVLERVKNRGTFIKDVPHAKLEEEIAFCFQLSGFSFDDLKEARICLETALVPMLIKRITPELIQSLHGNISAMKELAGESELADALDRDFHLLLFSCCGNRALKMFSNVIYLLFQKRYRKRFMTLEWVMRAAKGHAAILDAIAAKDTTLATRLIQEHIMPT
ncbi:MAG: hypothetical protein A2X49_06570 [Lentisphaerae bacterium GWF2_52_8]|nr:MAG: hypothetical protein A2X49_06570 [Lentisphaerae bacterium GWF2_52_8]